MRILRHDQKNFNIRSAEILSRRAETPVDLRRAVSAIIEQVERGGDRAVLELTRRFDKASLDVDALRVRKSELRKAKENLAQAQSLCKGSCPEVAQLNAAIQKGPPAVAMTSKEAVPGAKANSTDNP